MRLREIVLAPTTNTTSSRRGDEMKTKTRKPIICQEQSCCKEYVPLTLIGSDEMNTFWNEWEDDKSAPTQNYLCEECLVKRLSKDCHGNHDKAMEEFFHRLIKVMKKLENL